MNSDDKSSFFQTIRSLEFNEGYQDVDKTSPFFRIETIVEVLGIFAHRAGCNIDTCLDQ